MVLVFHDLAICLIDDVRVHAYLHHDRAISLIDDVRVHAYLHHHHAHGNSDYVFCFEIAYLFL